MADRLRLLATDASELSLISAALQSAVFKIGDMDWNSRRGEFTLAVNRFCWESKARTPQRVRSAIQFGSVQRVRSRKLRLNDAEAVVELMEIQFSAQEDGPGGSLQLILAGGGDIQIETECLDVVLSDVSEPWEAARRPSH